jgi:hypothetical protein
MWIGPGCRHLPGAITPAPFGSQVPGSSDPFRYGLPNYHGFMYVRTGLLVIVALALAVLSGCVKGDECSRCSSDDDCIQGLVCGELTPVNGESVGKRCVSGIGETECRVR